MLIRVGTTGKPAFQLRPGEKGLSIFDTEAESPALTPVEILAEFRADSVAIEVSSEQLTSLGLKIIAIPGSDELPQRLRNAHAEIRPGGEMSRREFKQQLRELEANVD